ncbi:MAG: pitrilysin family protein [Elusimicrobia bacterium]|nr:pitrilysin family protein [Elusimicrobiota bacterium]
MRAAVLAAAFALLVLRPPAVLGAQAPGAELEEFTLANGLRVVVSSDASDPMAALAVAYGVGPRQEEPGRSGFAHLFEHLMFEGSRNVPRGDFDRVLESYGGEDNAATHEDLALYYERFPAHVLPAALWLEADRMGGPILDERRVRAQIEELKEERRLGLDEKPYGRLVDEEISSRTFSNRRNARPPLGSWADLDAAKLQDLQAFFDERYAPANAVLVVAGGVDPARVKSAVSELFSTLPARAKPAAPDLEEPPPGPGGRFEVKDARARLPALALSWKDMPPRGSPDFYALGLLSRALAAGRTSRLYRRLVKESGAAVEVAGGLGFPVHDAADYQAPALWSFFVIHKAGRKPDEVRAMVLEEIARVAAGGLCAEELARVKNKLRCDRLAEQQTALGRARRLALAVLLDGDPGRANDVDRYLAVTPADVQAAAAKYLKPDLANTFELVPGTLR